jgi:FkbM family methyltransferase
MRQIIKRFLQQQNVYTGLKYHPVFRAYEIIFKPEVAKQKRREISFYKSFLPATNLIFDIGAYDGHKTEAFLHIAERVIACEPDCTNFNVLQTRFRRHQKRVHLENVALGAQEGEGQMFRHHQASAFNTLNEKFKSVTESDNGEKWNEKIRFQDTVPVTITTLDKLIQKYGHPFFIKIDVEGYELQVIKGLSQPVPFISIECLLPEFADELQENLRLLLKLDPNAAFNIAVHERLLFPRFLNYDDTCAFLQQFNQHHFELIVRMSG